MFTLTGTGRCYIVMAGLVPAIYAGTIPRQMAGTSPAMTIKGRRRSRIPVRVNML
jgi:hypothetical protein